MGPEHADRTFGEVPSTEPHAKVLGRRSKSRLPWLASPDSAPGIRLGPGGRGIACDNPVVSAAIVELAAIERGAGPAVTLIHGGVFHSGPAWARTIGPLVQAGYRVIAVDRRGYGRSPAGGTDQIPVSLQARDVAATLDLREGEASHVAGVSFGALVGLELALVRPERVL